MKVTTNYDPLRLHIATSFLRAMDECVGAAKRLAPVSVSRGQKLNAGDVQGGLRASINAQVTGTLQGRFGSPLRYAMMREKGGTILPVRKKLLSWVDPVTGKRIFAKRVTQRGTPYIQPAGERFPEFLEDHLRSFG